MTEDRNVARTGSSTWLVSDATAVASVAGNIVPAGIVSSQNSGTLAGAAMASSFGVGAGGAPGATGAAGAFPSAPAPALASASRRASAAGSDFGGPDTTSPLADVIEAICDFGTSVFFPSGASTTTCSGLTSTSLPATLTPSFFSTLTSVPTGGIVSGRLQPGRITAKASTIASFFIPAALL